MVSIADISAYTKAKTEIDKYTQSLTRAVKASADIEKSTTKATQSLKSQGNEATALKTKLPMAFDYGATQAGVLTGKALTTSYDPVSSVGDKSSLDSFKYTLDASGLSYPVSTSTYDKKDEKNSNPILEGASTAFDDYKKKASDVAGMSKDVFNGAFTSMENGITSFVTTGKFSFSDFTKSVVADMAKIAAQKAAVGILGTLFDIGTTLFAPSGASPSAGSSASDYTGAAFSNWLGAQQAKGGAWGSGVQLFANGGAFTNSVVSTPTSFGMAGGRMGLMGEAGPEAIIPLTRTSNGALGVRAVGGFGGGGGGASIQINAPVTVNAQNSSGDGAQLDQQALQQNLQKQMSAAAERAVADSWRAGGVSYRNANGRA
jgi:phage-related minor tail protein